MSMPKKASDAVCWSLRFVNCHWDPQVFQHPDGHGQGPGRFLGIRGSHKQEIIKVVDLVLDAHAVEDPCNHVCHRRKYLRGWPEAERKGPVHIRLSFPRNCQEMLVLQVDGDNAVGILQVDFNKLGPSPEAQDMSYSIIHWGIRDGGQLTWNAIVDAVVRWGRKVNYHPPLIGLGFGDQANWAGVDPTLARDPLGVPPPSQPLWTSVPPLCSWKQMGGSSW